KKYNFVYNVERCDPPVAKADVPKGYGACDHFVFISLIGEPATDEALSMAFVSGNGRTGGDLNRDPPFVGRLLATHSLAEELDGTNRGKLLRAVHNRIKAAVAGDRG